MMATAYRDLTLKTAIRMTEDPEVKALLEGLDQRVTSIRQQQDRFRTWCDRADMLYYAEEFTMWGADLWADHPDVNIPGRSHVSVNTPAIYVDVPAALQAVEPIENMLATENSPEARSAASHLEDVYTAWKIEESYELKFHKACTVKGLYGMTAAKVYWDPDKQNGKGQPCVELIEQPRNLYLGYKSDAYDELEWAAYVTRMEPNAIAEEFGVEVTAKSGGIDDLNGAIPYVQIDTENARPSRSWLNFGDARVEVWDYWYRKPKWTGKGKSRKAKMETYNIVFAGNAIVQGPNKYPEYGGRMPYLPLYNTYLPGQPNGRPELYDIEPLIREKFERITSGSQMIASGVAGDFWQLVGPEAPTRVPPSAKPIRNQVVGPGAGNRIESITPFIAQFQLEQYLGRLDREMAAVSGLNDLLLGLAPAQVLSSSKAINALIANYESRLAMRRLLLYKWRRDTWELNVVIWAYKSETIKEIVAGGGGTLDIIDPSLSPRDELETATKSSNLVNAKLWSQRRGMDAVGVDSPETEQDMIREERTDATMFPADVQVMAQLLAALQSLGLPAPGGATEQAGAQLASGQNDLRTALGAATPDNTNSSQLPGDQGLTPPEAQSGPSAPFAQAPASGPGGSGPVGLAQTMIKGGQAQSRILTQQKLGRR